MHRRELMIVNRLGLHARAAAKFVSVASRFESEISVSRDGRNVNGKSIMGIMMLAASKGTSIEITTEGPDEEQALEALANLIAGRFEEED
jgi:phosphocarrier protein